MTESFPPTDFRVVLRELVAAVPGAWGAIFVDPEGEAIDLFATTDDYEVKLAGAHAGILWGRLVAAGSGAQVGRSIAATVMAERSRLFVHALDPEYFVLLAAGSGTPAGLARKRLGDAVEALRRRL